MTERKIEIEFDDDLGFPRAKMIGRSGMEHYLSTLDSVKRGMDKEYGESNYAIEDEVIVY